jgi:hypothetical protein
LKLLSLLINLTVRAKFGVQLVLEKIVLSKLAHLRIWTGKSFLVKNFSYTILFRSPLLRHNCFQVRAATKWCRMYKPTSNFRARFFCPFAETHWANKSNLFVHKCSILPTLIFGKHEIYINTDITGPRKLAYKYLFPEGVHTQTSSWY